MTLSLSSGWVYLHKFTKRLLAFNFGPEKHQTCSGSGSNPGPPHEKAHVADWAICPRNNSTFLHILNAGIASIIFGSFGFQVGRTHSVRQCIRYTYSLCSIVISVFGYRYTSKHLFFTKQPKWTGPTGIMMIARGRLSKLYGDCIEADDLGLLTQK